MKLKILYFSIVAISFLYCINASSDESIELVRDGTSEYRIMLGNNPSPIEVFAGQELQGYLTQESGAFLPIASPNEPLSGKFIFVGESAIAKLRLSIDKDYLNQDGFIIKTINNKIIIVGNQPRGTLYGVYAFLEIIGCRWLAPGVNGEVIPIAQNITIPPLSYSEQPAFRYRGFKSLFPNTYKSIEWVDWIAKNKLNLVIVEPKALDDAKNTLIDEIKRRGMYLGISINIGELIPEGALPNETSSNLIVKNIADYISSYPDMALIELYDKSNNNEMLLRSFEAIHKAYPQKCVYIKANSQTKIIPTSPKMEYSFAFDSNTRCYRHSINDLECAINKKDISYIKSLLKNSTENLFYENCMANYEQNSIPFPILQTISEDIKYIASQKLYDGIISQCELDNWGTYGINYNAFSRFSWNPRYDLGKIVDDYCNKFFGSASEPLKAFYSIQEDAMEKMRHFAYDDPPEIILELFNENTLKEMSKEIEMAGKIANDVVIFDRIRKISLSLQYANLLWNSLHYYISANEYQEKGNKRKEKTELQRSLENCEELIKFIFQNVNEGVIIITQSFIFDYIEPIMNDIRNRLDSL